MKMRESRVLNKLRAGEIVTSFKLNLADGRVAELAAMAGFDCLWLDLEHVGNSWSAIEAQIWAAKTQNVDVMVRVGRGSYSDYIRPLELDAAGIMVPHVMGQQDTLKIVQTTRFHPIGRRPVDGGNADGAFCNIDFKEYLKQANEQRFVVIQIEDPEPLAELDAIAAIEGFDMLLFGPGDFSHSIGSPGDWEHPRLLDARKQVAEVAHRHGKFAGTVGSIDNFEMLVELGYQFINLGADVIGLNQYCKQIMGAFNKRAKTF